MKFIKNLGWFQTLLLISLGFLFSWFEKENITLFIFPGKSFDGRSALFQIALFGAYTLFFAVLCFLLLSLPLHYKNIVVFLAIALLLIYPIVYVANFLSFPYPLEYREAAVISPAIALANGINPYSVENFPEHIYLYGVLYPLTLAPVITLANHPLLIARAYMVVFLLAFCGLSFWIFRKRNASIASALIGVLILLNSMCYIWTLNGARPDAPALFFAFLGFYCDCSGR